MKKIESLYVCISLLFFFVSEARAQAEKIDDHAATTSNSVPTFNSVADMFRNLPRDLNPLTPPPNLESNPLFIAQRGKWLQANVKGGRLVLKSVPISRIPRGESYFYVTVKPSTLEGVEYHINNRGDEIMCAYWGIKVTRHREIQDFLSTLTLPTPESEKPRLAPPTRYTRYTPKKGAIELIPTPRKGSIINVSGTISEIGFEKGNSPNRIDVHIVLTDLELSK